VSRWEILLTEEVEEFLDNLRSEDRNTYLQVNQAILSLEVHGPAGRRPLVDSVAGSTISNLKELRPGSTGRTELRILFAFDPWRSAILLVAGDKSGRWRSWYKSAIPRAERLYETYLIERKAELGE
jgi:hypothetical protein